MKHIITVKMFCSFMSLTRKQAYELIANGSLDAVCFNGRILVTLDGLNALLNGDEADGEIEDDAPEALVSAKRRMAA